LREESDPESGDKTGEEEKYNSKFAEVRFPQKCLKLSSNSTIFYFLFSMNFPSKLQ
jgi:hypothetical protein